MVKQNIVEDLSVYDLDNLVVKSKTRLGKREIWKIRTCKKEKVCIPLKDCMISSIERVQKGDIYKLSMTTWRHEFKSFLLSLEKMCKEKFACKPIEHVDGCIYIKDSIDDSVRYTDHMIDCTLSIEGILFKDDSCIILWSIDDVRPADHEYAAPDFVDILDMKNELMDKMLSQRGEFKRLFKHVGVLVGRLGACENNLEEIENIREDFINCI